jgi:UDP-glucose:(heptosyl)LPS alpha-1,3-glucosyltransferase
MTFTRRADAALRERSFDVIHAISPCLAADVYEPRGGTVAETIERNLATLSHPVARSVKRRLNGLNFKQRYMLAVERRLLGSRGHATVIAISDYVAGQLRRHYGLGDERVRKVFNGVDPDTTSPPQRARDRRAIRGEFDVPDETLLVLSVAHNFRLKGVERWMEALARLVQKGTTPIHALVVGKGDAERWHRLAQRLGISAHLTFTGPSDRVAMFRHAADLLVHPTYYDPCSRVVMEGMIGGLPCVTTRWDGASELIEDGVNGFILDGPEQTDRLASIVDRLRDAGLRARIGEAAREVAGRASMARHAEEILDVYASLATAGAGRSR